MRIGIDIDGCIADIGKFIVDYGIKYCYENNIEFKIKSDEYDEAKSLGISDENAIKFWNEYLPYYATKYRTMDFVAEVINKLKQNNEIYIITARNEYGMPPEQYGHMQEFVTKWLADNKIEYDKIIYTKGSKLPYIIENNVDIHIEDAPQNVSEIAEKIPVLCFDNPYNKNIEGKNIVRVYSWYDILSKIERMNQK